MKPRPGTSRPAVREEYASRGVEAFYRESGGEYRNPHEPQVRLSLRFAAANWGLDLSHVLDLAAGSGEATLALRELGAGRIEGIDPLTFAAYRARTGTEAGRETFEQIAAGALSGRRFSLIVCSFALHLVEPSRLPRLCQELRNCSDSLLILTPHKRPGIRAEWGWQLERETVIERVRSRLHSARSEED